jgi:DNA-binding NtrC family response regulator
MKSNSELSIFLVDDDPFFVALCEEYLRNCGYSKITRFGSGAEFLKCLEQQADLIFLDYNMGSLNGIETLKKIKRFNPNSLVVFISGQEEIAVAVNALKYGAFDYLVKGEVNEEKLRIVMEKAIAINAILEKRRKKTGLRKILSTVGISSAILFLYKQFAK